MVASALVLVRQGVEYPLEAYQRCIAFILNLPGTILRKEAEICTSVLVWILSTFKDLQDALLAVSFIRSYALAAFEQRYFEACKHALRVPR